MSDPEEEQLLDEVSDEPADGVNASTGSGDSSDDDEIADEFEEDGFVVKDTEEGGEDAEGGDADEDQIRSNRKKRRRRKQTLELDEEDYLLLEDANINVSVFLLMLRPWRLLWPNHAVQALLMALRTCARYP